ncbi:MAG: helix-turn-helix domain-containing protein [Candidatus Zambryskibacteria bacterium]|nr:helix-turn-helix domain-containing protein [Candidatus Zambryskibacteria bacterium]
MEEAGFIPIGEAAETLGVSITTLRRWDDSGKLRAVRKSPDGNRFYRRTDLDLFPNDIFQAAFEWASANPSAVPEIPTHIYSDNNALFQTQLTKLQNELAQIPEISSIFPLVVSVAGEIGGNSFDHNIGQWPDIPGIFFFYHAEKREVVLADRGQGILTTLRKTRPDLGTHQDALRVAFTEVVSGRNQESRGNGLKYVKQVVAKNLISLRFQSGDAELEIKHDSSESNFTNATYNIQGCIAFIRF